MPTSYLNNSLTIEIIQSNGTTYSLPLEFNCYQKGRSNCPCKNFYSPNQSPFYLDYLYAYDIVYIYVVYNQRLTSPGNYKIIWKQNSTPIKMEMPAVCEIGDIVIKSKFYFFYVKNFCK